MNAEDKKPKVILRQVGDDVTLPCKYQTKHTLTGYLDIEWLIKSKVINESDKMIITLSGGNVYPADSHREISFVSENVSHGDASLCIRSLDAADSGIYFCKVKKGGIIQRKAWNLTVQDKEQSLEDQNIPKTLMNSTMVPKNSTDSSKGSDTSFHKWAIRTGVSVSGLVLIILVICLKSKVKAIFLSRPLTNTSRQPVEFQDNSIYASIQDTAQDVTYSEVRRVDLAVTYSTVQRPETECDPSIIYNDCLSSFPQRAASLKYS
ncbi:coxsackievirus and adenovirus receptor homolog isoform X2 [Narcine bancroftii]|uniref:coxsackievirus and adenovirus receptor homolog isoform X2 n=1 Tax=Narcine bancroftii TaxID=1343680 RepID=UPI003831FA39